MTLRNFVLAHAHTVMRGFSRRGFFYSSFNKSGRNPITGEKVEVHRVHHLRWLRSAVLGTNDGIISTASLILGVAAAGSTKPVVLIAGVACLVSGAISLAASEYVSASSQADAEQADLDLERRELAEHPEKEHAELADIYVRRGLDPKLASEVADQLMEHDALGAHARDELGLSENAMAHPFVTGSMAATAYSLGAALPLLVAIWAPIAALAWAISLSTLMFLTILGLVSAHAGGASPTIAVMRLTFLGALAMAVTFGVGTLVGDAF